MKKLLIYIREYTMESILGPLFKLFEACLDLVVPLVMAYIIDKGIGGNDKSLIIRLCLVLVGLGFVGLTFSITAQFFAAKASVGFIKQVKHTVFSHIQKLSFSDIDRLGKATLITRLTSDMNQIQTGVNLTLRLFLRSPFIVIGAVVMAFRIDPQIAFIFVVTIIVLSIVVFSVMLWCIPKYKEVQTALDEVLGKTRENLTGVRVIRAFCKENEEIEDFEKSNSFLTDLSKKVGMFSSLMNPLTYVIINIGIAVLIYKGAVRVDAGILTQGEIVALYNYMAQILVELVKFVNMFINLTRSVACGNRVQSILEIEPDMKEGKNIYSNKNVEEAIIEFKNVSLNYNGKISSNKEENALNDITFSVKKGETIGVIGGTGSGKTSLISLIPRFYDANKGEVIVKGRNVVEYSFKELRQTVAVVLQKTSLFKGSIRDNIKWGNEEATDEEVMGAIRIAQAEDVVNSKTERLDFIIEQEGRNLSGGQKQRLSIARALVSKPEILILDDSSSALDYATDLALRKRVSELDYKPTVFIVSQRTASIMQADKIVVMDEGEMVGIGRHEELLDSCEVYREIYNSQYK
ncbi:MAG: ABC transporter ATP-binding protein [Catonella sp.]|uniref:ABC transporter ATP-binding protein n=1 Tax=Catonella sp. TaxID=2382125 RepID=UPI003FA0C360